MKNRKALGFIIPFIMVSSLLVSCGKKVLPTYKIVFQQDGYENITITVEEGKKVENIPSPAPVYGHTVKWNVEDFSNVKSDLIVNAISTPNTYVLTYNASGFDINGDTYSVTFGSVLSKLEMSLTREDATFLGWEYDDVIYTNESIWDVATNARLTPAWKESEKCVVTFIDSNGSEIKKTVVKGKDLADVPTVTPKTGYEVRWDTTDFTNIQNDMTVKVIETPKTYVVTLDPNGGSVTQIILTMIYDQNYTLEKPSNQEFAFVGWMYGTQKVALSGKWNIDSSEPITLIAEWGESDWTDIL